MSDDTTEAPGTDEAMMSFREHLAELRNRLVRIALALLIGFFIGWEFKDAIFGLLSAPITRALADNGLYSYQVIGIAESIIVYLKAVLVADLVCLSPFVFYQLWGFVAPGLHVHERRFVVPISIFSVLFFAMGVAFSYQVILPFVTDWLVKLTLDGGSVQVAVTMQNAFSTAFTFLLMFGVAFQLPLVIFFLSLTGTVSPRGLLRFWRYFVVLSFVISAMLTPPDPISQVLMGLPLNVLYGFGILVAWVVERNRNKDDGSGSVGVASVRAMGGALVLLGAAVSLGIVFVSSLPGRSMTALMPSQSTWLIGLNPAALDASDAEPLASLMSGHHDAATIREGLKRANIDLSTVTEAAVLSDTDGARIALLRATKLASHDTARTLVNALPAHDGKRRLAAVALDEDTLAFGHHKLVEAVIATATRDIDGVAMSEEEERLVKRLSRAGPAWAWVPSATQHTEAFVGQSLSHHLSALGAWVSAPHDASRDQAQLTVALLGKELQGVDTMVTRLEASRLRARDAHSPHNDSTLINAIEALILELETIQERQSPRLTAAKAALARLKSPPQENALPLFQALGDRTDGWALRREERWIYLSSPITVAIEGLVRP